MLQVDSEPLEVTARTSSNLNILPPMSFYTYYTLDKWPRFTALLESNEMTDMEHLVT